ncbi:MAG: hypothetical protein V2J65_21230, partial [Desulfobacteraceae bacterium]|nr:hypothetical protein [Desulfobacteraceae bacterium]
DEKLPQGVVVRGAHPARLHQHHRRGQPLIAGKRCPGGPAAGQYQAYLVTQVSKVNSMPFVLLGRYQKKPFKVMRINQAL